MEKETGKSLKVFRSDGGGEFTSGAFKAFLDEKGIKREVTNAYTPQENGISERANRTLNNIARSMMADAKEVLRAKSLPLNLWSHAVRHAAWIKNRIPSRSLEPFSTPFQSYYGRIPTLATLRLFGCKAYAHTPKIDQTKFGERTVECIHVGFTEDKKAYTLYSRERRRLFESRDVEFEEGEDRERVQMDDDSGGEEYETEVNDDNGIPEGVKVTEDH